MADKEWVIHSGPYYYNNKPIILWPLELDFELNQEHLSVLPLWVKLLGLPVGYRSIEGLSKVASAIEKPIRADNYTANVDKISYARVLIETVEGLWRQPVAYDWRPKYCNNCLIFRHEKKECWYKEKEDEVKEKIQTIEKQNRRNRKKKAPIMEWQARKPVKMATSMTEKVKVQEIQSSMAKDTDTSVILENRGVNDTEIEDPRSIHDP
ncbi:hypothetical protein BC332_20989 [Capsicum chinense]|nr:hypothetical protein BC332_20989 [Capsicum chinense]